MSELLPKEIARVSGTEIENWGEREIISEMVERVMWLHPEAKKVGRAGVFAACQLAMLTGASPVPGHNEIHLWWNDGKQVPTVMLGINFDRRRANEVAGGVMFSDNPRPMTKDERLLYGIPEKTAAAICKGFRSDRFDKYIDYLEKGLTLDKIIQMMTATGHAICFYNEPLKKGRSHQWTAEKRAEADLLRKLVPNLENPERTYRMEKAKEHLAQLDMMVPHGDLTDEQFADYQASLFGDNVVNGESEEVKELVHWSDIQSTEDALELALKLGVFENYDAAQEDWADQVQKIHPDQASDMFGLWQAHCEKILWDREHEIVEEQEKLEAAIEEQEELSLDDWLETNPSVEEVAARAVVENLRENLGDVYNDLMPKFAHLGDWRNVDAKKAWAFLTKLEKELLPHPWLAQMWQKILQERAKESKLQGEITKGQIGKLLVLFGEKYADMDTDGRHKVTEYIFGKFSLNEFSKAEASVLIDAMESAGEHLRGEMDGVFKLAGREE